MIISFGFLLKTNYFIKRDIITGLFSDYYVKQLISAQSYLFLLAQMLLIDTKLGVWTSMPKFAGKFFRQSAL